MTGRQPFILAASFSVTFAVLVGGLFAYQAVATPATTPAPTSIVAGPLLTPPPTVKPIVSSRPSVLPVVEAPAASAQPTAIASPAASNSGTATMAPLRSPANTTAPATPSPQSSGGPGRTLVVTVQGTDYVDAQIPQNGTITKMPDGSVRLETTRMYSDPMVVTYELPADRLPTGTRILGIQGTKVCGSATGDFWESYGPDGSDPTEHEFGPPQPDGCWHYGPAPGPDTTVTVGQRTQTVYIITKIEYTVTIGP